MHKTAMPLRIAAAARVAFGRPLPAGLALPLTYEAICRDARGRVRWSTGLIRNLVTTVGQNDLGNTYFRAGTQVTSWYIGLKNTGTIAAGDTSASHGGWTEFTTYSESVRQTLTLAAFSGGSSTNASSPGVFTISGTGTVAGSFLISVSTKGGATGVLYSVVDFNSALPVAAADVVNVTVTVN